MEYLPLIIFAITYTTALITSWIRINLKIKEIEVKLIQLIKEVSENEMNTRNNIERINTVNEFKIEKIEDKIDKLETKFDVKLNIIIDKLDKNDKQLTILNTEHQLNQCSFNKFIDLLESKTK